MDNTTLVEGNSALRNVTVPGVIKNDVAMKSTFGLIAALSFFGNLFLCVVIVRKRSMLKKAYNVLIFNLAVADMLTGIFIVATPDYLIDRKSFPYPEGLAGEIYCRLIGSTYILFIFGKASTSTIMCLAIDRWYSIVKPIQYKTTFSRKRLYFFITLIWILSCLTQVNELFIATVEEGLCTFIVPPYGNQIQRIFILIHVSLTFYVPSIITWISFAHILYHLRKATVRRHRNNNKATHRLLRMCALAAFFLSICWLPTETFFILYKFEVLKLPFTAYLVFGVLAMFNSCINPWIYCLSNKEYRREFTQLLCCTESSAIGLTGLIARVSETKYSFSNALSSDNLSHTCHTVLELRRLSAHPESIFTPVSSSPVLRRFSMPVTIKDGLPRT